MSTRLPVAFIAQTFALGTTAVSVTDSAHTMGGTVSVSPSGTRYFRILAASAGDATASTATTEVAAVEFLNHLEQRFGGLWEFGNDGFAQFTGKSRIKYVSTGTASLTLAGTIAFLLGFEPGIYSFAENQERISTYQMAGVFWALNTANGGGGFQRGKPVGAYAKLPDGRRYGWQLGVRSEVLWTFETIGHPADSTEQASLDAWGTPLRPDDKDRWKTPPLSPTDAGLEGSWSYWDFVDSAMGHDLGVYREGGSNYDLCHLDVSTWEAVNNARTSAANWDAAFNIENLTLSYIETRSF